jgi:RNA polymerase sigma factor (sigma-70 family)
LAAVPSIGRATRVERKAAPGADAAGELYERYSAQIFGYCLHQLGSREEAEDAVQTTFMNAFRGLSRGIVPELESAWLFKIAHNVCLSRRRSSWRRGKIEAPNNFEVLQEVIPGRETIGDELIRLQDVLEEMPENQRRAILLREWQGLTYREISTELGITQAAVETLIFRARRALAQGLEQDADTWKRRLRRGADVGGAIACIKALLGGGGAAAVKVAATALAVGTAAVAATTQITPQHTHHARPAKHGSATRPASLSHFERTALAVFRPSKTAASGTNTTTAHRNPTRASQSGAAKRTLPRPIAAPRSAAPGAATASIAPAEQAPAPGLAPAPSEAAPPAATPPSTPAPVENGRGKGKDKKTERTPQATTQIEAPLTDPEPLSAPSTETPAPQPQDGAPGQEKKNGQPTNGSDTNGKGKGKNEK